MAKTTLVKKLGIEEGHKVLIMNAPKGYMKTLGKLPRKADASTHASGMFNLVQVFVHNKADVDTHVMTAISALGPGGRLWLSYPKKSSKIKTDISRDTGWEALARMGWEGVTLISIDETWSAMRFRPSAEIKRKAK